MKRTSLIVLLVSLLALFLFSHVSAEEHIGSTNVQMIPVDSYSKQTEWGSTVEFDFGLLNTDNASAYTILANASVDNGNFAVTVFPSNFTLAPESFRRLLVNVTALGGTGQVKANVYVHVQADGPVSGNATFSATIKAFPRTTLLDVATGFAAVGSIILIGFSASWVFERTKFPDVLFLIFLGLFLGPIAAQYFGIVIVSPTVISMVMPYISALALVMILFDGGLNLNLDTVIRKLGISSLHTIITFFLSVSAVVAVSHFILGYPLIIGLLLGVVLGGTSGIVVVTLVRKMRIHDDTKTILTLESVITDVICVILAISIIEFLRGGPGASLSDILPSLAASFSIAIVVALIFGVIWLRLLTRFSGKPFAYMVTIAALLVMYASVEFVGGSGAAAALVFGLVLGNHEEVARMFKIGSGFVMDEKIKQFQMELAFVVRTFFFVFLGLVFTIDIGGDWAVSSMLPGLSGFNGTFVLIAIGVVLIFLGFIGVRYLTAFMTTRLHVESLGDRGAIFSMLGRGLAAAVLATLPFTVSAFTNPGDPAYPYYTNLLQPYQPQFLNIAFLIILLTVGATTVGVMLTERRKMDKPQPTPEELRHLRHRAAMKLWKKKESKHYKERIRKKKEWRKQKERL